MERSACSRGARACRVKRRSAAASGCPDGAERCSRGASACCRTARAGMPSRSASAGSARRACGGVVGIDAGVSAGSPVCAAAITSDGVESICRSATSKLPGGGIRDEGASTWSAGGVVPPACNGQPARESRPRAGRTPATWPRARSASERRYPLTRNTAADRHRAARRSSKEFLARSSHNARRDRARRREGVARVR